MIMLNICEHCGKECNPVELDDDKLQEIDYHGMWCLTEVDQAVHEGLTICPTCYEKEGGII